MKRVDVFEARCDDPAIPVLKRSWVEAEAARARHREEAEARVREWTWGPSWAGWERYEPFWSESMGERPKTRRLKSPPARKSRAELFGFDADGHVVVHRRVGDAFGHDDLVVREALRIEARGGEAMLVFETSHPLRPPHLSELHLPQSDADGRLRRLDIRSHRLGDDGFAWSAEAFEYDAGRLVASRTVHRRLPLHDWEHRQSSADSLAALEPERSGPASFRYGDDGALLTISVGEWVVYRRRATGELARAAKLVRAELPARIAAWLRRAAPAEPIYCLGILYSEHYNNPLPPALGVGTHRELRAWREHSSGDEFADMAFNPAEFACVATEPAELTDDPELVDAYQALNQEWRSTNDDDAPRRLFVAVAKSLAAESWTGIATGPEGLAIYATDVELSDLPRNLKATVPAATRRALLGSPPRGGGGPAT